MKIHTLDREVLKLSITELIDKQQRCIWKDVVHGNGFKFKDQFLNGIDAMTKDEINQVVKISAKAMKLDIHTFMEFYVFMIDQKLRGSK